MKEIQHHFGIKLKADVFGKLGDFVEIKGISYKIIGYYNCGHGIYVRKNGQYQIYKII